MNLKDDRKSQPEKREILANLLVAIPILHPATPNRPFVLYKYHLVYIDCSNAFSPGLYSICSI